MPRIISKWLKDEISRQITRHKRNYKNLKHFIDRACYDLLKKEILAVCPKDFQVHYKKADILIKRINKKGLLKEKEATKIINNLRKEGYYPLREYCASHSSPFFAINSSVSFYEQYQCLKRAKKDFKIISSLDKNNPVWNIVEIHVKNNNTKF
ncbi:MAG: hypothetical protein V1740_01200 [Candidatus Woesearchaeota archaeon]